MTDVKYIKRALLIPVVLLIFVPALSSNTITIRFNDLSEWDPLYFPKIKKHSIYRVIDEKGKKILMAESDSSASGIIYRKTFDINRSHRLSWRWKIWPG